MDQKFSSRIDSSIRERQSRIMELLLFGVAAGICMAIFSFFLGKYLEGHAWPCPDAAGNMVFWGMVFLGIVLVLCYRVMAHGSSESETFRIVLPFKIETEGGNAKGITLCEITGYAVTNPAYSKSLVAWLNRSDKDEIRDLGNMLLNLSRTLKSEEKKKRLNAFLHKLVFVYILQLISHYSENTLSEKCAYLPHYQHLCCPDSGAGRFPLHLSDKDKQLSQLVPDPLLPFGFKLYFPGQSRGHRADICLESPYARLTFRIPGYWAKMTRKNSRKSWKTATRFMEDQNIALISLGLTLTMDIRLRALAGRTAIKHCNWLAGLVTDARQWLSWDHYMETDQERMLVDLHQHFIQKKKPAASTGKPAETTSA